MSRTRGDDAVLPVSVELPAAIDRATDLLLLLMGRYSMTPGPECGVVVDGLRQLAAALDRARGTADMVAAVWEAGYAARISDERAETEAGRANLRAV